MRMADGMAYGVHASHDHVDGGHAMGDTRCTRTRTRTHTGTGCARVTWPARASWLGVSASSLKARFFGRTCAVAHWCVKDALGSNRGELPIVQTSFRAEFTVIFHLQMQL